ncbi:MAG: hypothetical protein MJ068_02345 [Clostridia bacterium]|nr:hypothetical protein [Clostridia bacterium]
MSRAAKIIIPLIMILGIAILALALIIPEQGNTAYAGGIDIAGQNITKSFYVDDYPGKYLAGAQGTHKFKIILRSGAYTLEYGTDYQVNGWAQNYIEKEITTSGSFSYTVTGLGNYAGAFDVSFEYYVIQSLPQGKTLTYDGTKQELITAGTSKGCAFKYSLDGLSYDTAVPVAKDAGTYTVFYAPFLGNGSHGDIQSLTTTISKAPLTIKSDEQTIAVGSDIMAVSLNYIGLKNGETGDVLTGEIHVETDYRPGLPAGDYAVALSGLISSNYEISYNPGMLNAIEFNPEFTAPVPAEGLVYTGTAQTLLTPGQIQTEGASFTYSLNEKGIYSSKIPTATEGGKYTVWYKVNVPGIYCDFPQGHVDAEIHKITYDMSGVRFEGLTVAFDGIAHSLYIEGDLPEGVEVTYGNNSQSHPGRYTVTATFKGSTSYEDIEPMTAELIILATEITSEIEPGKAPFIMIESPEGIDPEITIHAEMLDKSVFSLFRYEKYNQMFAAIYSIKIMKGDTVLQPEDITADGILTVKILLPNGLEPDNIISVLNAYSKKDVEEIIFNADSLDGRYYVIEADRLNEFVLVANGSAFCYWHYILAACIILYVLFFILMFIKFRRRKFHAMYIIADILFFAVAVASYVLAGHFCYYCLAIALLLVLLLAGTAITIALAQRKDKKLARTKKTFSTDDDIDFYKLIAEETTDGKVTFHGMETEDDLDMDLFAEDEITNKEPAEKSLTESIYPDDLDDEILDSVLSELENDDILSEEELKEDDLKEDTEVIIRAEETAPQVTETTTESNNDEVAILPVVPDTEEPEIMDDEEFLESEIIDEEGNKIIIKYLKSYKAKLILSKDRTKHFYNILKNEILSYKNVKARMSWPAEKFRSGRNTIIMFRMTGGELTAYFDLDPKAYSESEYLVEDVSEIKTYASTPAMCKIVAQRRLENALKLIEAVMEKHGLKKEPSPFHFDYTIDLKNRELEQLIEEGLIKESKTTQEDISPVMSAKIKNNNPEISK